ncbi:MAG: hypothetical protein V1728_05725 [Candidatus Micrarchaeota archaeon]
MSFHPLRNTALSVVFVSTLWAACPFPAFSKPIAEHRMTLAQSYMKQANEEKRLIVMELKSREPDQKRAAKIDHTPEMMIFWENEKKDGKITSMRIITGWRWRAGLRNSSSYTQIEGGKKAVEHYRGVNTTGYPAWNETELDKKQRDEFFKLFLHNPEYKKYKRQIKELQKNVESYYTHKKIDLDVVPKKTGK